MERAAHNQVKTKIGAVLTLLAEQTVAGTFFGDRMLLTNVDAALSTEPDGMFLSYTAIKTGHVILEDGGDSLEVEGSPDMVLEVISPSSVHKDTVILRDLYWQAGIGEYWLADSRGETASLEIFRRGPKGYVAGRKQGGWVKSPVFGKSFRLTRAKDPLGNPAHSLAVR
jgi:Uma2 family endonuclease